MQPSTIRPPLERAAGMGALVVEGEDRVALAHEDEVLDAELGLDRHPLGDVADLERRPLRAGRPPGMAVDHVAEREHDVAPGERAGRQDEERHDRQRDRDRPVGR